MKVLVTGSNGLIGRWLVERLQREDHEVFGLDRSPGTAAALQERFHQCDIMDRERLFSVFDRVRPEGLVHLAARVDLDEQSDLRGYAANIDGVRFLTEAVRRTGTVRRGIYTSSQLVCRVGYLPSDSEDYCPDTLYGQSKVRTEQIVRETGGGGGEWCLVRPTTVWGPHMSAHYQKLLSLIRRGLYFHVGRGPLRKSYAYAGNIAYQIFKLLVAPASDIQGQMFYLADYIPLSLVEYTNSMQRLLGARAIPALPLPCAKLLARCGDLLNAAGWRRFPFNSFRLRNILTEYVLDLSATRRVCGDLPYTFNEGIQATAAWYLALTAQTGAARCAS